jgi:hypothetical protein
MNHFAAIADWLIILAFLGLIITVGVVVWAAVRLTKSTVRNAKRIYERPVRAFSGLTTTGQAIVTRNSTRVRSAAGNIRSAATAVAQTSKDLHTAGETLTSLNWKPVLEVVMAGAKFATLAAQVAKAASNQGPSNS